MRSLILPPLSEKSSIGRGFRGAASGSAKELDVTVVVFMISLWGVHTPPIKMDRSQNKGVAGRAFCK